MRFRLLRGLQRVPRVPLWKEGTSKININQSKVPLVPSVPSIISRARAREKWPYKIFCKNTSTPCKIEGTKGTEGTKSRKISVFWYPLRRKGTLGTLCDPLEAFL